jgi:hypothetical protein
MEPAESKGRVSRRGSGACAAQVFLRSRSGRSYRDLREGPLPQDLSLYLPTPSARQEVTGLFSRLGFRTYADDMGLTISIEGSPELFSRIFGVAVRRLAAAPPTDTIALRSPEEVRELIEEIVLLPRPELHRPA